MDCKPPRERVPLYLLGFLSLFLRPTHQSPLTDQDIELVSGDGETPHCFSRNFEDLTCFWEMERTANERIGAGDVLPYAFYYNYEEEPANDCNLTVQYASPSNSTRYICHFLQGTVRMFNDLTVTVTHTVTNQTLYSRTLEVEKLGLIDHPTNIKTFWAGSGKLIQVTWSPPNNEWSHSFMYHVQYWPENAPDKHDQIVHADDLPSNLEDLQSDLLYHLRVRTKVSEEQTFWGPWSEAITFVSPASTDKIGLHCFTPDLFWICCKWSKAAEHPNMSQHLFYQYRGQDWQLCTDTAHMKDCNCAFIGRNDTPVSVILNVSSPAHPMSFYYKEPFQTDQVVSPPAPELYLKQLSLGKVALNWTVPLSGFDQDFSYEIRFSKDRGATWKTLQVPRGVFHEVLDLISGSHYTLQIRACPTGDNIQGFWSLWSAEADITLPSSNGWLNTIIILILLSIPGAVICVCCVFRSFFRKLKTKLWPPMPNLHRVLDTFLIEIQKQYQPHPTLYEKPVEEPLHPSCLEILAEEALSTQTLQISRDYVQLSPPMYQNEDYWPNVNLDINTTGTDESSNGISNQTYLTIGWNV
ncbi:thrombopoietin receptor [Pelodytes ibericus]